MTYVLLDMVTKVFRVDEQFMKEFISTLVDIGKEKRAVATMQNLVYVATV
jgi:hypothetical protein